jgi:hypothetical protein
LKSIPREKMPKKEYKKWEEPEYPFIADWALYVRIPFDDFEKGDVLSWHSTERGARLARKGDMRLGIRLREGKEWIGIDID